MHLCIRQLLFGVNVSFFANEIRNILIKNTQTWLPISNFYNHPINNVWPWITSSIWRIINNIDNTAAPVYIYFALNTGWTRIFNIKKDSNRITCNFRFSNNCQQSANWQTLNIRQFLLGSTSLENNQLIYHRDHIHMF